MATALSDAEPTADEPTDAALTDAPLIEAEPSAWLGTVSLPPGLLGGWLCGAAD
jgi:hypothetical protein